MDYEMPIMDGPTATSKLKELGSKIPVVGVTGNVLKADTDFFIGKGVLEVLHKPLKVNVVKDLLTRQLKIQPFSSSPPTLRTIPSESIQSETKQDEGEEWFMMALNL
mmetsp:Transcript_42801/g.55006  ORF Transcript_42801/g.55006 Transcript_42801/m.55006 type:complete len:107 (-) Transcript_42801:223-543(-)